MKKSIVLVHGAWMDASVWYKVTPWLEQQGFEVIAVNLPGHGSDTTPFDKITMDTYVDAVKTAIGDREKVILAGHSMAGMVISAVAEQIPSRIGRLVYIAAYLPQNGESLYQISQQDKDSHIGQFWRQDDPDHYSPAYIAAEGIAECFAADAPLEDIQRLVDRHKADALGPMVAPVALSDAHFGALPKTYICTKKDNAVSYNLQQWMTQRTKVDSILDLDTSHSPFFSAPEQLARMIAGA